MSRRAKSWALVALLTLALMSLTPSPASGDSALELVDGRVLTGIDVRRDGAVYLLTLESGQELAFPVELVRSVQLIADKDGPEEVPEEDPLSDEPPLLVGGSAPPEGPSGIRIGQPQNLAGSPVAAPRTADQLAAFGEKSKFQGDIVDNSWAPTTDWDMDPATQNNFNPSTWAKAPVDSSWEPTSAWDADDDVLKDSRSTWSNEVVDSSWTPTDAFANSPANR